jgi:hypothetical protein
MKEIGLNQEVARKIVLQNFSPVTFKTKILNRHCEGVKLLKMGIGIYKFFNNNIKK